MRKAKDSDLKRYIITYRKKGSKKRLYGKDFKTKKAAKKAIGKSKIPKNVSNIRVAKGSHLFRNLKRFSTS